LDVVIAILGCQFKDVINITTPWMMLARNNEVTNVGKIQFTKLVLDVLWLFTVEKLHRATTIIIKHILSQKVLVNTQGNHGYFHIKHVIHLLYNQPSNLIHKLPTLSIRNKMFMDHTMNCHSWDWLESMHNIIDLSIVVSNVEGRNMTIFASKQRSKGSHCHLTYD